MKTAIVYSSNHGTTAKVARRIQQGLGEDKTRLFNLKNVRRIDLSPYERVLIGGSIHAGSVQKRVRKFIDTHFHELLEKPLGLFLCCMDEQREESEFENAFPEALRSHAISCKIIGGEFLFEKMNIIEKAMVKKVAGVESSVSRINDHKIDEMVEEMNHAMEGEK